MTTNSTPNQNDPDPLENLRFFMQDDERQLHLTINFNRHQPLIRALCGYEKKISPNEWSLKAPLNEIENPRTIGLSLFPLHKPLCSICTLEVDNLKSKRKEEQA